MLPSSCEFRKRVLSKVIKWNILKFSKIHTVYKLAMIKPINK